MHRSLLSHGCTARILLGGNVGKIFQKKSGHSTGEKSAKFSYDPSEQSMTRTSIER